MTTPTAAPALNPRVIALAHYAARAILENVLARHGVTFQQSVMLRLAVVAELVGGGLLTADSTLLTVTDTGRELYRTTSAETAPFSARVYAGIPAEDLAVAGRVLSLITERANAELAAMAGPAAERAAE